MKVEVRPLPEKKWHNKQGKESIAQAKAIEVLYDDNTGRYNSGLTAQEITEYSEKLGVSLDERYDAETPHPYYSTKPAIIKLENNTMVLDDEKPSEFVKIKNMKASKHVANSMAEYEKGLWPFATHVIYDEQEDIDIKASKIQNKRKAGKIADELSIEAKRSFVQVLSEKSLKGQSNNFIEVELEDIIENKTEEFLRLHGMGKEEVNIRSNIFELLAKNVLTKEGSALYYMGDPIAMDFEAAVKWFKDPNNQLLKITILEKLNK